MVVIDANRLPLSSEEEIINTAISVRAMEELLKYRFKNTKLLEEALTHSPCPNSASNYQRQLIDLRAADVKLEKLARVAVWHVLYKYLRGDSAIFDEKVMEFVITVQQEEEVEFYGGTIKVPKVLADIVELGNGGCRFGLWL